jgi:hypothetical protein
MELCYPTIMESPIEEHFMPGIAEQVSLLHNRHEIYHSPSECTNTSMSSEQVANTIHWPSYSLTPSLVMTNPIWPQRSDSSQLLLHFILCLHTLSHNHTERGADNQDGVPKSDRR